MTVPGHSPPKAGIVNCSSSTMNLEPGRSRQERPPCEKGRHTESRGHRKPQETPSPRSLGRLNARNFLFHSHVSLPAEGPGSEGVRGEVGGAQDHRGQESPESGPQVNDFPAGFAGSRKERPKILHSGHG